MTEYRDQMHRLPVPVTEYPFWRVVYRPENYAPDLIPNLTECARLVEKTRVRLRGWDFPHLSNQATERSQGSNWIGSWANFMGEIEYWQLFQSGQFIHLAALREATERQWRAKLQAETASHLRHVTNVDWNAVPGFVSLVNLVYTITEVFEFAARICQAGVYRGKLDITIELNGIKGYVLTTEMNRMWRQYCIANENRLDKTWRVSSDELVSGSAEQSLKAIAWLCECFGWLSPNLDALRSDQQKLLSGRL